MQPRQQCKEGNHATKATMHRRQQFNQDNHSTNATMQPRQQCNQDNNSAKSIQHDLLLTLSGRRARREGPLIMSPHDFYPQWSTREAEIASMTSCQLLPSVGCVTARGGNDFLSASTLSRICRRARREWFVINFYPQEDMSPREEGRASFESCGRCSRLILSPGLRARQDS